MYPLYHFLVAFEFVHFRISPDPQNSQCAFAGGCVKRANLRVEQEQLRCPKIRRHAPHIARDDWVQGNAVVYQLAKAQVAPGLDPGILPAHFEREAAASPCLIGQWYAE